MMDKCKDNIDKLNMQLKKCNDAILSFGNETRQSIIIVLMDNIHKGMRVGEIAQKTHLSRPAVSHHIKILKDAKIVALHKKGTMNFYHIDVKSSQWNYLSELFNSIYSIIKQIPENSTETHIMEE